MYQSPEDYNTLVKKLKQATYALKRAETANSLIGEAAYYLNKNFKVSYLQMTSLIDGLYTRQRIHQLAKAFSTRKDGDTT